MTRQVLGCAWILLLLVYGFILVVTWDAPPFSFHQWREADSANFVLNYADDNEGLFLPKIHQRQLGPGYAAAEFPGIYYLSSFVVDPTASFYWKLRLVSLAHLILALASFMPLVTLLSKDRHLAQVASLLCAANPLMMYYGIKIMPDIYYMAWGLCGCYLLSRSILKPGTSRLSGHLGCAALVLSCVIKPFGVFFLLPPLYLCLHAQRREALKKIPWLIAPVCCLFLWNSYAKNLTATYSNGAFDLSFDTAKWLNAVSSLKFYERFFASYLTELYLGFGGTFIVVLALILRQTREQPLALLWAGSGTLLLCIFGAHHLLTMHDYYGIILVPALAWYLAGILTVWSRQPSRLLPRLAAALLLLTIAANAVRMVPRLLRPKADYRTYMREAAASIPLTQRVLVLDDTPVVKLNLINRHGKALPRATAPENLWPHLLGSPYWFVCFKDETACATFASHHALASIETPRLLIIRER